MLSSEEFRDNRAGKAVLFLRTHAKSHSRATTKPSDILKAKSVWVTFEYFFAVHNLHSCCNLTSEIRARAHKLWRKKQSISQLKILPWDPPSLLLDGYRVSFLGAKRSGRGVNHPPPSSAEVKESVELYLYSPSWPSWSVIGELCCLILPQNSRRQDGDMKQVPY
jgi:hypothetical protein